MDIVDIQMSSSQCFTLNSSYFGKSTQHFYHNSENSLAESCIIKPHPPPVFDKKQNIHSKSRDIIQGGKVSIYEKSFTLIAPLHLYLHPILKC